MRRNLKTIPAVAGSSPFTEGQLRWYVFQANFNGLAAIGAVVRVGRRVYLDVDRFETWIEKQDKAATA